MSKKITKIEIDEVNRALKGVWNEPSRIHYDALTEMKRFERKQSSLKRTIIDALEVLMGFGLVIFGLILFFSTLYVLGI